MLGGAGEPSQRSSCRQARPDCGLGLPQRGSLKGPRRTPLRLPLALGAVSTPCQSGRGPEAGGGADFGGLETGSRKGLGGENRRGGLRGSKGTLTRETADGAGLSKASNKSPQVGTGLSPFPQRSVPGLATSPEFLPDYEFTFCLKFPNEAYGFIIRKMTAQLLIFPATSDLAEGLSRRTLPWGCRCFPQWIGGMCARGTFSEQRPPRFWKTPRRMHQHSVYTRSPSAVRVRKWDLNLWC